MQTDIETYTSNRLQDILSDISDLSTGIPRIAKDKNLTHEIELLCQQLGTKHQFYRGDSRKIDYIQSNSVHLIVTSPPYWTLRNIMIQSSN